MIVALDFDGTLVKHTYPEIGEDIGAVPWLHLAQGAGARFILWTMRDGPELEAAVAWCAGQGVILWGVNQNPDQASWCTSPKAFAHLYVDDLSLGVPLIRPRDERPYVDWERAGPQLMQHIRRCP